MYKEFDDFTFKDLFDSKPKYKKLKLKEGDRRQVSVLFADLSGFTALSEKLDSEEVQTIIDKILTTFTKCIEHFGGNIDKYEGDLVMAHFGAIKASERDTERAISSGLLMLKQLHIFNRKLQSNSKTKGINLDVRIGINTGDVTTGKVGKKRDYDFTVYGPTVNLASRMESNAPLNRIMIPKQTKDIVKDTFEFEDFGEIAVKGIVKPISVFLVKDKKDERIQRWESRQSQLVGRQNELNILGQKYEEIQKRSTNDITVKPIIIGIAGEPGIGKSRLVYEFLQKNTDFVLFGSTPKVYQTHFALFTSMLSKYFKILRSDSMKEKRSKLEEGYQELESHLTDKDDINELKNSLPLIGLLFHIDYNDSRMKLDGKELLIHIQTAIRHFIEAAAAEAQNSNSSLIVVLEDLHWLDDVSAKTINILIETLNLEKKRLKKSMKNILFIFIYRPEYELPGILKSKTDFTKIELLPLESNYSNQIIKSMTKGNSIPNLVLKRVMDMSLGNPFYLEEWCNLVNDLSDDAHSKELPIPNSLNALITARIDRLDKDMKQLLQNAAVIGKEFLTKILSEVENRLETAMNINDFLNELESNEYLRRILGMKYSKYFFKHILTHEVAYKTLLHSNRRLLHKLVAEIIEEQFEDNLVEYYFELANHYTIAEINDKAIEYLEKAGDLAKKNFDNQKAIELYDKIISLSYDSDEKMSFNISIQLKKTEILILIGKLGKAQVILNELLIDCKAINNKNCLCLVYKYLSHIDMIRNNLDEAGELFAKRMKIAKEINDQFEIMSVTGNLGIYYLLKKEYEEALTNMQDCLRMAIELNDIPQIIKSYTNLGLIFFEMSNYENSLKFSQKSIEVSKKNSIKNNLHIAQGNIGMVYTRQNKSEKALNCFEESLKSAEEIQDKKGIVLALGNIGNIYRSMNDFEKALEYYHRTYKMKEEMGMKKGMAITCSTIAKIYEYKNKYEESEKFCIKAIQISEKWKLNIATYKLQRAGILFLMRKYRKAKTVSKEAQEIIKSLRIEMLYIESEILNEKIYSILNQKEIFPFLQKLLQETEEGEVKYKEQKLALINMEIWNCAMNEGKDKDFELNRINALKFYEYLFNETGKYEYQYKLNKLKNYKINRSFL